MGIIESPLFERDISTDKVNKPANLFMLVLNKVMFKGYPDVVSVAQLSEMLSISEKTVYRMVKDHRIGFFKVGRTYKFAKVHIFDYLGIV